MVNILNARREEVVVIPCHCQMDDVVSVLEWKLVECFINVDLGLTTLSGGLDDRGINKLVCIDFLEPFLPVWVVLSLLIAGAVQEDPL